MKANGAVLFLAAAVAAMTAVCGAAAATPAAISEDLGLPAVGWVTNPQQQEQKETILDLIPLVSQIKSLVHWAMGDPEGSMRTNQRFIDHGFVVSQGKSAVLLARGEFAKAVDEQTSFLKRAGEALDNTPVVGELKMATGYVLDKTVIEPAAYLIGKVIRNGPEWYMDTAAGIDAFLKNATVVGNGTVGNGTSGGRIMLV